MPRLLFARVNLLLLSLFISINSSDAAAVAAIPKRKQSSVTSLQTAAKLNTGTKSSSSSSHWDVTTRGGASTAAAAATASSSILTGGTDFLTAVGVVAVVCALRDSLQKVGRVVADQAETAKFLLAGAVAGIVSRTAVSPLEVVATLQMVQGGKSSGGLIAELTSLYSKEGIAGFFKGNGANCLKVAPTRGIQFFCFEALKGKFMAWKLQQKQKAAASAAATTLGASSSDRDDESIDMNSISLTPLERLVAGGAAGMVASSLVYPLEVVKTMLTMYPGKYGSIAAAFRGVIAETGMRGLYKGLKPTLIAMFPYVGVEFMIYETSKIALEAFLSKKNNNSDGSATSDGSNTTMALPVLITLGLGAIAGAAAQTAAHPLDVVRKRLQVQGLNGNPVLYRGTLACFQGVAAKEGFSALYRGLRPACVATIPGTGIAYITYEVMKKVLGLTSA